jgi:hypothetical protein
VRREISSRRRACLAAEWSVGQVECGWESTRGLARLHLEGESQRSMASLESWAGVDFALISVLMLEL